MTTWRAFPLLIALSLPSPGSAQVPAGQIDAIFSPLKSTAAPGASVLVVHGGQVVFSRGYGVADLRTFHPIDGQTDFRLASFTKQFTATCVMLLVRDGKLHYDDHLTDFFPEFPAYGKSITIRNLLNHTSGLPDYEDILEKQYPNTPDEKIPQILDAGVLKLLEQQTAGKFPAGIEVGVQQLRLRDACDDRGKSLRQALRPFSSRPNLHSTEDDEHAGLREGKKRSAAPRLRPHTREKRLERDRPKLHIRSPRRRRYLFVARGPREMGWRAPRSHSTQRSRNATRTYSGAAHVRPGEARPKAQT